MEEKKSLRRERMNADVKKMKKEENAIAFKWCSQIGGEEKKHSDEAQSRKK